MWEPTTLDRNSRLTPLRAILPLLSRANIPKAISSLGVAQAVFARSESSWSARERLYLRGFESMMGNDLSEAISLFHQVLDLAPNDLFAIKKAQLLKFVVGDRRGMVEVAQRADVAAACENLPYYHGMLAFALEENDQVRASDRRQGVRCTVAV